MIKNETISKAEMLAQSLIDGSLQDENNSLKVSDPLLHLRDTTANFINKRFEKIQKDIELEEVVVEALQTKIKQGSVSFSELANFLNQLKLRSADATDGLLNFFKPQQGESSPLLPPVSEAPEEGSFSNISPQDLQALQKVMRLLESDDLNRKE